MDEDQIRLETKITFVEKTVSDLNEVVYEQQKMIDQLRRSLQALEARLAEASESGDLPHQKPPHY